MDPSPALLVFFTDKTTAADRDRLVGLLADFCLVAIHEDDVARPATWTAHFGDETSRNSAAAALRNSPEYRDLRLESVEIEDEDWARRTQADLPAIRVGRIVVAPPWDVPSNIEPDRVTSPEQRAPSNEIVIVIEPSRGFGTGHHQSTRLCLVLLQNRDVAGRTMIDVGTGSGVLAIVGALLGAASVSAIDIDPDAIQNARENAIRNGVERRLEVHVGDLSGATLPAADIVTANLTGSLLVRHASDLSTLVRPAGMLIAAGFTADERDLVTLAFAPGMSVIESAEEDGWWGFVLVEKNSVIGPRFERLG